MKKEKVLTFSVKVRQKRKHMTTVCGLELFGRKELLEWCVDVDIKTATKAFGKKFSCGASAEKNAENMMEITIQGDVAQDLGQACHDLYDVWFVFMDYL